MDFVTRLELGHTDFLVVLAHIPFLAAALSCVLLIGLIKG